MGVHSAPRTALVFEVFPFEFELEDEDTLARVEVHPDEDGTYLWSIEMLAEVISRLILAGEDGDEAASDLAGFLVFCTTDTTHL